MKILVIGANGQIGSQLVEKLQASDAHEALAMVRKKEQEERFLTQGISTVVADLEDTIEELAKAVKGVDAIVFAAGSGGKTAADKTILIDLNGAVKAMEAAKKAGVKRFVIVSAIGTQQWLEPHPSWLDQLAPYYAAKFYADEWLQQSGLDYTIVRPGALTNDAPTGKVEIAATLDQPAPISRCDVADLIVALVDQKQTINKSFDVINGSTKITAAIKNI
ncbi:MAG TPA: SDR family oxidoreductase [Tetragenococcus sp.]|nr:SDR family oxidoreductase [Tetragenococcus sp.]